MEKANNNKKEIEKEKEEEKGNRKEKEKGKPNNNKKNKKNSNKIEKEKKKGEILKEKRMADPKQNKPPLKSIVVYHGANQGGDMESNKECPNIKSKKS